MREVVAYARARGIRVVPEFDMPGHTTSWPLAYPGIGAGEDIKELPQQFGIPAAELDPSNEKRHTNSSTKFIGEMAENFPDQYFHIGGDETRARDGCQSAHCGVHEEAGLDGRRPQLQDYFKQRLLPILKKHGNRR